jgi:predicted extracellular nuclease
MHRKSRLTLVMMAVLLMFGMVGIQPAKPVMAALPTDLFFSEYIEGGSYNKAIEIYNGTGMPVDLSDYRLELYTNGAASPSQSVILSGMLATGEVFVAAHGSAAQPILDQADLLNNNVVNWNGDDGIALRKISVNLIVDVFGQTIGVDPGDYWGTLPVITQDRTLVRKANICAGDPNGSDSFDPINEWDMYPKDTVAYIGSHTSNCVVDPPVINEFSASTTGTDVEFVEFFGSPNTDYSAYTLLGIEGDANATNSSEGFVDNIIPLGTTNASGLLLVSLAANTFENGSLSLLLVKDSTATSGVDIDTNDDGVIDVTYWSEIRDGVAVNDGGAGDLTYATPVLGALYDGLPFAPGGASRFPDGTDTDTTADWVRNDFDLAGIPGFPGTIIAGEAYNTPGASNHIYVETAPSVISTIPANGGNHPMDENITITFSEPVTVTAPWFSIVCATSGPHTATVNDVDPVYTLNPDVNFTIGESCTVTITAANVVDDDTDDTTFDAMLADYTFSFTAVTPPERCGDTFTPIYEIQGSGETSPLAGTVLATEGVVVGDFQVGGKNGYFIQDVTGDGNPATSDGIFVYNTTTAVNPGDHVRVRGTAVEYLGITEISPVTQVWICSTGNTVAATEVTLPVTAVSDFERYESMLVTFPQSLIISEYFNFDRYGEIVLTSGRHMTPTALVEPGAPAQAEAAAYLLDRITLDDGRTNQNPDPAIHPNGLNFTMTNLFRGGGTVTNVTGILDFYQSLYRVQPTAGAIYADANPRTTAPDITESDLKVTSFNVLNYFVTLDDGVNDICGPDGIQECRGADDSIEFGRQKAKIVAALAAIDADVYGLMEIENDSPISLNDAVADLVAGLNAVAGAGTYDYIQTGAIGGDAIKQAILYKPASVTPVGAYKLLTSAIDPRFIDTANRPALAQTFMDNETGAEFVVAVNHLKSKGSACVDDPDLGDGQGNCNLTRLAAAQALVDWLANPTYFPDVEKALIIGDLNSYDKEDPIDAIKLGADDTVGTADDYLDMIFEKRGDLAYGYVFDGQTGYLDHALANLALAENIVDVNFWHINADEPDLIDYDTSFKLPAQDALYAPDAYRSSDHDPVIVTLSFKGDFFVTQDFGPWGSAWVGAYNLGWKYNDSFDINTIASIEVGMLDAAGNLIVKYTADAEQVAWQIANAYITPGGQESAPFYQEYDGTPIAEGRGENWTVVFGPSFAGWNPTLGFVKVVNLNGTVDYKTVAYAGTGDVYNDIFETQDFGLWGPSWPAAFNLGWKYNDSFDIETIKLVEVGMIDASGNIIVRYTADLEQVAWQIANGYITPGGQESAPFYQEYNGIPIAEGRDLDWTVIFGPSFTSWNPTWAFVKVETLDGQMEYKLVPYLGVPALVDDMFEITDFGLWGDTWPGALNLGWGYTPEFDTDTIASIEVGMLDANGDLIVRYTADSTQVGWQKANGYITPDKLSSAPFYHYVIPGVDLDWTVILGPAFDGWNPALGYVRVVNTAGQIDYDEIAYTGSLPDQPPFLNVTGVVDGETALTGDMENGYILNVTNNPAVDHELQFAAGTTATEALSDEYFGLTLISSTVTPEALKAYYDARGVPAPYLQYLKDAADGLNPFVYIKGSDVTLVDAAMHDLGSVDVPMTIPDDFPLGTYVVRGTIYDVAGNGTLVTFTLIINDIPVAEDQAVTTPEETAIDITLVATDIAGEALTYAIVDQPAHGTVTLVGNIATYTPALNYFGEDSFTFTANDGMVDSNIATVTITVTEIKDQVVAVDDFYTMDEDTTLTIAAPGVLANDIDVDNNIRAASLVTDVQHGKLSLLGDGSFTYTPDPDFYGTDTFVYKLITYPGPQSLWTDEATVTITVNPIGDAPVLGLIEDATIPEMVEFSFTATATDVDLPAQVLTFSLVGAPDGAEIDPITGVFTWTPSEEQGPGEFTFTVKVCDDTDPTPLCDEQAVTLTVTEVNTAPVAQDLTETTEEDTPVDITLMATDAQNDPLTYAIVDQPTNGSVTLVGDVATYTPELNFNGEDSFTYKANDGLVDSEMAVVTITVTPVNDAPVAVEDAYTTDEDVVLTVLVADGVLANDTDIDGDTLTAVLVDDVSNGTLALADDGSFVYTPAENFFGTDSFTYKASDGTLESEIVTVTLTINPVNDWVVANDDEYETPAGVTLEVAAPGVLTNDELLDPNETVTLEVLVQPTGGAVTLNDDGSFTYVPNAGFFGVDTFEYQLNSTVMLNGEFSDTALVTIKVTPKQIFLPLILR